MRPHLILLFAFLISFASVYAQTRKIAHRSHSGKPSTFTAYWADDNFGATPAMQEQRIKEEQRRKEEEKKPSSAPKPGEVAPVPPAVPPAEMPESQPEPSDTVSPSISTPLGGEGKVKKIPKGQGRKARKSGAAPESSAVVAPGYTSSSTVTSEQPAAGNNGWMLLVGLMLFPVGPAAFFLSAVISAHGGDGKEA